MGQHQGKCGASLLFSLTLPPALGAGLTGCLNLAHWFQNWWVTGDGNRNPPLENQGKTGMTLSANQAAKEAGIAKKTLLEAIKNGRLSASKNDKGYWVIEPSELFRVFPKTSDKLVTETETHPPEKPLKNNPLQAVLDAKELIEVELRQQIEDLRTDRDEWRKQAQQLALPKPETATEAPQKPAGLFGRIFGKG